ncbi:MAG: hypothetical protein JO173_03035 [Gammaproteobacteria bacterium]|nr:hypothetical protein [Gammaproteobacteria bacterium]
MSYGVAIGVLMLTGLSVAAAAAQVPDSDESRGTPGAPAATAAAVQQLCRIDLKPEQKEQWIRLPKAETSVTQHRLAAGGKAFDYTATAGLLIVRNDDDKPIAAMSYVAYTRRDSKAPGARPVMFAFNGGPGSSSMWLHMGVLGPKRVVVSDAATSPAPYRTVDNEFSVLDRSDLVMIDAIGTGLSRAVCGHKDEEFWGVDPDVDSFGRFIAQYLSDNLRWTSPKYLLGESYGSTRAPAIVNYLRNRRALAFNGLILVSVATDIEAIFAEIPGNDRPYAAYLPAYAAVAWYHHALPSQPPALEPFLSEVRAFAMGEYATALLKGDALSDGERTAIAEKMHAYTGLPEDYLKAANLRVAQSAFTHELLRARRLTVGRLDGRFTGATPDPLAKDSDYDPQAEAISAAYAAAFLDYYHGELRFGQGGDYRPRDYEIGNHWKWTHNPGQRGPEGERTQMAVNSGVDLAEALFKDANLRVLVMNGIYDLATPFSATEYVMTHLGVPPEIGARIQMKLYEAGHMMYVNPASIAKFRADLDAFIDATARQ